VLLGPVAAAGACEAFAVGLRTSRAATVARRLTRAGTAVAGFVLMFALPAAARWGWFLWQAHEFPLPADARDIRRQADPVDFNGRPHFAVGFLTASEPRKIEELYKGEFAACGWSVLRYPSGTEPVFASGDKPPGSDSISFAPDTAFDDEGRVADPDENDVEEIEVMMLPQNSGGTWVEVQKIDRMSDLFYSWRTPGPALRD
jgi:hypothetical protein